MLIFIDLFEKIISNYPLNVIAIEMLTSNNISCLKEVEESVKL